MGQFNAMKLTNKGLALFNKVQSGTQLQLTKIAIGDGSLSAGQTLESLTALVNKTQDLTIIGTTNNEDGTVSVQTTISNQGLLTGKYIREIGLYATDPIEGEILYSVTNAGILADYLPPEGTNIVENIINIVAKTGNASSVNAVIDKSLIYASAAEIGDMSKVTGATNVADKLVQHETALAEKSSQLISKSNYEYRNGIVSIVDDDGSSVFFTGWKAIADSNNIKLSSAINTSLVGTSGKMTLAQLQQLKAENFDILSHFYTHLDLEVATLATIETEMQNSLAYLKNNNLGDDLAIVYTKGLSSITDANKKIQVKSLARKYYKYGINDSGGVNYLPVDSYEVKRRNISLATQTLSDIKAYIDEAYANNQWLVILTHSNLSWNAAVAQDIIAYIQSLNMPIMTFREAENYLGNVISHGDTRTPNYHFVSKTGASLDSNIRKPSMNPLTISSMDAPISEYDYDKTTEVVLSYVQDTVLGVGGIMKVYRGQKFYSYALFYPSRKKQVYRRYWDDTTLTWSAWTDLTSVAVDSEVVVITRDLSVAGVQSVPITITSKEIKSISLFGSVNSSKKTCQGAWNNSAQSGQYQDGTSGNTHTTTAPIVFSQDSATNRTQGALQFPMGGLNINWSVLSGTGCTGMAQLVLSITYK